MAVKRCIVHIPNKIDQRALSGSQIRPLKMIQAFKDNEYHVDVIMGSVKERKLLIKKIKDNIEQGVQYDFIYSESSTMPTLLTEKNHIPKCPFLDFDFFLFCKKRKIKIGLFYRDIQWKFPSYKESVSVGKRIIATLFYRYDLIKYNQMVDVFYLPTERMKKYLQEYPILLEKTKILMPGCDELHICSSEMDKGNINIFYVGGITGIYDIKIFLDAINKLKNVNAIICCRKPEWDKVKDKYQRYLSNNIKIVHASGKELEKFYEWADICSVLGGTGEYFSMAMPVKVFEYLAKNKPMIGIKGTASGEIIENENIGWTVEYKVESIQKCLIDILKSPETILEKKQSQELIYSKNTWKARAEQVIKELK